MANLKRIDVHHHIVPVAYQQWLGTKGMHDAGGRELPEWSVESALRIMGDMDIATAILSLSAPGVHVDPGKQEDPFARSKAREMNELAAGVVEANPDRFGLFATLTLPDIDGALQETAYAFDELNAAGVILLANTHGEYLGAPEQEALFAELDRRRAVVFIHPNELPGPRIEGIVPFGPDFLLDTTRAAYRLVRNDVVRRYPNIRLILSHAVGFVPFASHRLAMAIMGDTQQPMAETLEEFASFYFDTALSGTPAALPSLLAFAKPGHVLFGSDVPFAPPQIVSYYTQGLDRFELPDVHSSAKIDRLNAEALVPLLAEQR